MPLKMVSIPVIATQAPAVPTYWWNSAFDRRLVVSATNNGSSTLSEHIISIPVPSGVTIDSDSLRVVEITLLGSIDRAYDWRYGSASLPLNHFWTLPCTLSGGTLTVKALGKWAAGETRAFGVYWDSTSAIAPITYNHLNAISIAWTSVVVAGTAGDTYRLIVGGVTYTHVMTIGQTASDIATALRALINAGTVGVATGTIATVFVKATNPNDVTFTVVNTGTTVLANLTAVKPNYFGAGRVGPDTEVFDAVSYWMGYPYHNPVSGVFSAPGFGRSGSILVRLMTYNVNTVGVQRLTGGTITSITSDPEKIRVAGTLTYPTRSGDVDWTASYVAEQHNIIYGGRKTDDTGPESLMKMVDAVHVVLTYTCNRAYAPTAVSGSATALGTTELLGVTSTGNFNGNVTESAGNKIPFFEAPVNTGVIVPIVAGDDLSGLPVTGTIFACHSNVGCTALLINGITLSNFGSQAPEAKFATSASAAYPILHLRNLSAAANIPIGATIVIDFWVVDGLNLGATTIGDKLLPDEVVAIMRGLTVTPSVSVGAQENYQSDLETTMTLASQRAVDGLLWFQNNALARTGLDWNGVYQYHVRQGVTVVQLSNAVVDDHDGSYGNSYALAGLCLRYLRTHDTDLLPIIAYRAQWILNTEALAVSSYGSYWSGSVPYWIWTMDTPSAGLVAEGGIAAGVPGTSTGGGNTGVNVDPTFNGGLYGTINYTKGQVRRLTSVDQLHMMALGLYHYLYLLRNESAITSTQTYVDMKAYLARMVTFEAAHWTAPTSRICANLNRIVNGLSPNVNVVWTVPDSKEFDDWQISNLDNFASDPSANIATDLFFCMLVSPNVTYAEQKSFIQGRAKDMLAADYGRHDVVSTVAAAAGAVAPNYPKGWLPRALGGTYLRYTNGRAGDDHWLECRTGYRDALNGRAPHRGVVVGLAALLDPTYNAPVELVSGTPVRTVNIADALDELTLADATYLIEPTTKAVRYSVAGTLGKTSSFDPQVIDTAFSGYSMFEQELWWLVHNGAPYTDYYPIGTF